MSTTAATAAGDGRARTAILVAQAIDGGVPGGSGNVVQANVAAVRVDGRHVVAVVATLMGRSRMWPTRLMTRYSRQAGQ